MKYSSLANILLFLLFFPSFATARLGETPAQCKARYGNVVADFAGHGKILGVAEFEKDGIHVLALFGNPDRKARLVIYSRTSLIPDSPEGATWELEPLKENEITSLYATVAGKWIDPESDPMWTPDGKHKEGIKGPVVADTKGLGSLRKPGDPSKQTVAGTLETESRMSKNVKACRKALQPFLKVMPMLKTGQYSPPNFYSWANGGVYIAKANYHLQSLSLSLDLRMGQDTFSFRLAGKEETYALIFLRPEGIADDIKEWSVRYEQMLKDRNDKLEPKDPGSPLSGF